MIRPHRECGAPSSGGGTGVMFKQTARDGARRGIARSIYSTIFLTLFLSAASECFGDQLLPLTVERPEKQSIVLTQGFSTTIHSERPFGKIAITNPQIVDLVLRTDKSAVLIPEHPGRTNVDFLDEHGSVIGSMDIVVVRQSVTDRVVVYDRPTLGAYSSYHCGQNGCEHFDEIPAKEQALTPNMPGDHGLIGMPPQ
jgi:Pilus formation protein N terminal region